ncbi:hypothetical protein B566_EDAN012714 [Ephemera danica]|nr:hypothetical protein B566_EDAN012714 [Ephemera danica]
MLEFLFYIALAGLVSGQNYRSIAQAPSLVQGSLGPHVDDASSFLRQYDVQAMAACQSLVTAQWDYATNVTEKGAELAMQELLRELRDIYSRTLVCPAPGTEFALSGLVSAAAAATRTSHRCTLRLDPELTGIMRTSRDPPLLSFAWRAWRDAVGPPSKHRYIRLVQLSNIAARRNGFRDVGEQWRAEFEQDISSGLGTGLMEAAARAWHRLEPLYRQLHAYVRRRLAVYYGAALVKHRAPIPAHLLGNMWAQSWSGIEDLVMPFPNKKLPDVSLELSRQGYTPLGMLQVAESWFTSIGLPAMPEDFWRRSILHRPTDRPILCGASAWDFCDGRDYRIKMCANPSFSDFISAHHELAHVQYYMHYATQPTLFRDGANPALHEAVGEMVGLAVTSPDHLQFLGLFPGNQTNDEEVHLNYLMRLALDKIAFIPFSYLVDLWRWRVFAGEWEANELNERWWQLRVTLQGVAPPVKRSPVDFDPATKRHIATHRPYIGYMVSGLLQFQLFQALCRASGHRGELHRCDLQNRREAGRLLSQIMSMGASKPWPEILSVINGGVPAQLMDPEALIEFFQPLEQWLRVQNGRDGLEGWDVTGLESGRRKYNVDPRHISHSLPQHRRTTPEELLFAQLPELPDKEPHFS